MKIWYLEEYNEHDDWWRPWVSEGRSSDLDTITSDQIFFWRLTEMIKIWLDTLTTPCKSIFDRWWQGELNDTNIGSNWRWKILGGVKNTIDQLALSIGQWNRNSKSKLKLKTDWLTNWLDYKKHTDWTYLWQQTIGILGPSPQASYPDDNLPPAEDVYIIMCNDPSSVTNLANGYLLEFFLYFPWAGRKNKS